MNLELRKVLSAREVPPEWDNKASEYFQTREFLLHTEAYNPCHQRYYLFYEAGTFTAGLVVYTLTLNLFTYASLRCPLSMHIAGIPCSVSASGFIGNEHHLEQVFALVKAQEKGFLIVLNLNSPPALRDVMIGSTLPTLIMQNNFPSWDNYLSSLRSDYRRRVILLNRSFGDVRTVHSDCSLFTEEMHRQYLDVLSHSKGKLETLSYAFFRNLPGNFSLTACYDKHILLGWYITVSHRDTFYFFLGGFDYHYNPGYNTYFNLLNHILQDGIKNKLPCFDLGQTSEVCKMRLGAVLSPKWMLAHHSNWLIRKLLIASRGLLQYKSSFPETHIFKEQK